jgi:hypothetical protein
VSTSTRIQFDPVSLSAWLRLASQECFHGAAKANIIDRIGPPHAGKRVVEDNLAIADTELLQRADHHLDVAAHEDAAFNQGTAYFALDDIAHRADQRNNRLRAAAKIQMRVPNDLLLSRIEVGKWPVLKWRNRAGEINEIVWRWRRKRSGLVGYRPLFPQRRPQASFVSNIANDESAPRQIPHPRRAPTASDERSGTN